MTSIKDSEFHYDEISQFSLDELTAGRMEINNSDHDAGLIIDNHPKSWHLQPIDAVIPEILLRDTDFSHFWVETNYNNCNQDPEYATFTIGSDYDVSDSNYFPEDIRYLEFYSNGIERHRGEWEGAFHILKYDAVWNLVEIEIRVCDYSVNKYRLDEYGMIIPEESFEKFINQSGIDGNYRKINMTKKIGEELCVTKILDINFWWVRNHIRKMFLDIVIAMTPLDLQPYILLEIIDYLPWSKNISNRDKINRIIAIRNTMILSNYFDCI